MSMSWLSSSVRRCSTATAFTRMSSSATTTRTMAGSNLCCWNNNYESRTSRSSHTHHPASTAARPVSFFPTTTTTTSITTSATTLGQPTRFDSDCIRNNNYTTYSSPTFHTSTRTTTAALVPMVLESSVMGERVFDIYSRLLRERIICVHGPITDDVASVVTAQLLFLEADHPDRPLFMYINSPGGVVTAGLAIYDTMQYIQPAVHTICMGLAASMASLLLAGGERGCRFSLPHSKIMLHQPSSGASGMASDIEIAAKEILKTRATLNQLYCQHTQQSLTEIERVMDRDTYMDVSQAMEFGIIDSVMYKRATAASTTTTTTTTSGNESTESSSSTTNAAAAATTTTGGALVEAAGPHPMPAITTTTAKV